MNSSKGSPFSPALGTSMQSLVYKDCIDVPKAMWEPIQKEEFMQNRVIDGAKMDGIGEGVGSWIRRWAARWVWLDFSLGTIFLGDVQT